MKGTIGQLIDTPMATWRGWACYYWDHCCCVALFDKKPEWDHDGWSFQHANERISQDFLEACGILMPPCEDLQKFYYDPEHGGTASGMHEPVQIELVLPLALLQQLDLK